MKNPALIKNKLFSFRRVLLTATMFGFTLMVFPTPSAGTQVEISTNITSYPQGWPTPKYRLDAVDGGVVLKHGDGPNRCDELGARDVWVWKHAGIYYMHYDGAAPKGWLTCLATSKDLVNWTKHGAVLDLGEKGRPDSATASYGTTFWDGHKWQMFYLGSPNCSPPPDRVPMSPYLCLKAESDSPSGPWHKQYDVTPLRLGGMNTVNASPGYIIHTGDEYRMFFSGAGYIGIARTRNLDASWQMDPQPALPARERIENTTIYFEPASQTWWLFTNHIGDGSTDAVWVYWTKDLEHWNTDDKAVVLDGRNCTWSKTIIGLPSVVKVGRRLALFYDGNPDPKDKWHMNRDIGLAWLNLPLVPPAESPSSNRSGHIQTADGTRQQP